MPSEGQQLQKQEPHPHKHNKNKDIYHNMRYESDSETEESQITKHLHIGLIELCPQPDITTYNLEDIESDTEPEHSLTTHLAEKSQSDKESITSSIELQHFTQVR